VNDIEELIQEAARPAEAPPSDGTVEADLRRGRAALARRRRGRTLGWGIAGLAAVLVTGTAIVASNQSHAPVATQTSAAAPSGSHATGLGTPTGAPTGTRPTAPAKGGSVRLVAYHGDQLDGFVVDQIPQGWFLQGSNPFSLTVAPDGDTSSPDGFEGKLVVMLLSKSAPQRLPNGTPVQVDGHDGVISHGPPADLLTYEDGAGHFVQVQAWTSALHWTDEQLISFAEGVHVTADAQPGVG